MSLHHSLIYLVILIMLAACGGSDSGDTVGGGDTGVGDTGGGGTGGGGTSPSIPSGSGGITPTGNELTLYVAPDGKDSNPGSLAQPFASLERAKQEIRDLRTSSSIPDDGVIVYLRGGEYQISTTFQLTGADSGTALKPVTFMAYNDETVRLQGGVKLAPENFVKVPTGSAEYLALDASVRDSVLRINLNYLSSYFGQLQTRGYTKHTESQLELVVNGVTMHLARYPNKIEDPTAIEMFPDRLVIVPGENQQAGTPAADASGVYYKITGSDVAPEEHARPDYKHETKNWYLRFRDVRQMYYLQYCDNYQIDSDDGCSVPGYTYWYGDTSPMGKAWGDAGELGVLYYDHTAVTGNMFTRNGLGSNSFEYRGSRPERWLSADDVWMHGLWDPYNFSDYHVRVTDIDSVNQIITFDQADYTSEVGTNQSFYVYNLLEELDAAGEYYLDRNTGYLYYLPDASETDAMGLLNGSVELFVSTLDVPMIEINADYVRFSGIIFEISKSTLLDISGNNNIVDACIIRNAGASGLELDGSYSGIQNSEVAYIANDAIRISGGSIPDMIHSRNYVTNNNIHHFSLMNATYAPGVNIYQKIDPMVDPYTTLSGIGITIDGNEIHHATHSAIIHWGNNNTISNNNIHHVVQWAGDSGAIYSGRSWGARGNVVKFNYIHEINNGVFHSGGVHGVYLDDVVSGDKIYGNIFHKISGAGIVNGGGRDNHVVNNLFVDVAKSFSNDNRQGWFYYAVEGDANSNWNLRRRINAIGHQTLYDKCLANCPNDVDFNFRLNTYLSLRQFPVALDDYIQGPWCADMAPEFQMLEDTTSLPAEVVNSRCWFVPQGTRFTGNTSYNVVKEKAGSKGYEYLIERNNVVNEGSIYIDPEHPDFSLTGAL